MATIGRIEEFCEDKEEWSQYEEQFQHFFATNGITNNDKKCSVCSNSYWCKGIQTVMKPYHSS